jgi:uncharacterized protein YqgQ
MSFIDIKHKLNYSPNLGRALIPKNMPINLYKKIFKWKKYSDYKDNTVPVYSNFLNCLLKEFKHENILKSIINDLKSEIKYPQTFSLKKDPQGYRFEIYFYYNKMDVFFSNSINNDFKIFLKILKKHNCDTSKLENLLDYAPKMPSTIWSYDFYDYKDLFGTSINFYEELNIINDKYLYWGKQYTKQKDLYNKDGIFLCFPKSYQIDFKKDLHYNFTESEIMYAHKILDKYDCLEHNISNKKEEGTCNNIFFTQYFGLSNNDYIKFLEQNKYSENIINEFKNNLDYYSTMSKEITEVYNLSNLDSSPYRCALYGLI